MEIEILRVGELQTNCYILIKEGKCLIIDPGADEDFIISRIKELNIEPVAILNTHSHFDHIGAVQRLKEIYGIEVYNHDNLFEERTYLPPFTFKVIYTPGHSQDSITFYFESYETMFTGDFIFHEDIGRNDLPTSSYSDMLHSIAKIKNYDKEIVIYPGHGSKTTLGHEITNNNYFK